MKDTNLTNQIVEEASDRFEQKFGEGFIKYLQPDLDYYTPEEVKDFLETELRIAVEKSSKVTGDTSDGYHTFNELYDFRKIFNAALFNEWYSQGKYSVHKSLKHGDGELAFGGGWFIVMATLPTGQISNHYELKDWNLFRCEEREKADVWDGHTAKDTLDRLSTLTQPEGDKT